jgi:hypothetical protein
VSVNFCGCCVQDTVVCGGGPDRGMAASDQHRGQLARREGLRSPGRPSCIISTVAGAHRGPGEAHDRVLPVGPVTGLDRGEEPGQPGDAAGARRAVVMAKKSSSVRLFFARGDGRFTMEPPAAPRSPIPSNAVRQGRCSPCGRSWA